MYRATDRPVKMCCGSRAPPSKATHAYRPGPLSSNHPVKKNCVIRAPAPPPSNASKAQQQPGPRACAVKFASKGSAGLALSPSLSNSVKITAQGRPGPVSVKLVVKSPGPPGPLPPPPARRSEV